MVDTSLLAHYFRNPNLFDCNAKPNQWKPNYLFLSSPAPHRLCLKYRLTFWTWQDLKFSWLKIYRWKLASEFGTNVLVLSECWFKHNCTISIASLQWVRWWFWTFQNTRCRDQYVSRSVSRLSPYSQAILIMFPLFWVSYYMLPIPDYAGLFRSIPVSTGNYSSCLNIHLLLSCALFLSDIAVFIRPYSGLHHLSLSFHWAPVGLIRLTSDSFFRLHHFA